MKTTFPLASALRQRPESPDAHTAVTLDEDGNLSVSLVSGDHRLTLAQRPTLDTWAVLASLDGGADHEPLALPEPILVRANRLLSEAGVSISRDWRTKTHVLRGGYRSTVALANGDPVHATITPAGWKAREGWPKPAAAGSSQSQPTPSPAAPAAGPVAPEPEAPASPAQRPAAPSSAPVPSSTAPTLAFAGTVAIEPSVRRKWKAARAGHAAGERALVAIMGPSGQAKTHMVAVLAAEEGVPVVKFDCGGVREPGDYFGMPSLENGSSVLLPSTLLQALRSTEPVIVLLDEANRADLMANNVLFPILDGSGTVTIPQTGKVETVNPFAFFVLTANVGSEFLGAQPWDEAFRTRITTSLHVEYPDSDTERGIIRERYSDVSDYDAANLVALANLLRENAESDGYPAPSTRQVLAAAWQIVHGLSAKDAADVALIDGLPREGGSQSQRNKAAVHAHGIAWKEPKPGSVMTGTGVCACGHGEGNHPAVIGQSAPMCNMPNCPCIRWDPVTREAVTLKTECDHCQHGLAYHGLQASGRWVQPAGRAFAGACAICAPGHCNLTAMEQNDLSARMA